MLKLFISQLQNEDMSRLRYLKEQIECAAEIGKLSVS